jgi:excisionase family DNA binding protein
MSELDRFHEPPAPTSGKTAAHRVRRGGPARADRSQPECAASDARQPTATSGRLTADDVMTAREVAALLHSPTSTVEDWARRGILPSVKIGRRRLYIRQNVEAVLIGRPAR